MEYFCWIWCGIFILNLVWGRSILKLLWRRTRDGNGSGSVGKSFLSGGSAPFPGKQQSVSERAFLHAPRSSSRALAAVLSPGTPSVDVWGGRGTVMVPRGVRWRKVEPMPSGAYWNQQFFKDTCGHHHHYHRYGAALHNRNSSLDTNVKAVGVEIFRPNATYVYF